MAGFAFFARSLQQIATFIITLLAARFLLPAEYGVYSLGIIFITLVQTLTYTGFYHFIINSQDEDDAVLSTSFWLIFGLSVGAALLLCVGAYPIGAFFNAPDLSTVLLLLALVQPIAAASAWCSAVLLRREAMQLHFTVMFVQNLTALVGGIVLLLLWQSLFALVAYRYVRVISGAILYIVLTQDRPQFRFDRLLAREAAKFSGGLYGSRLLTFLSRYSGDLLLGAMFSTAEAGLYRFGNRIASGAVDVVGQPMASFAVSRFGAAGRAGNDLAIPLRRFLSALMLVTGGVASTVLVFAEDMVTALFNPAYLAAMLVTYAMAVRSILQACASVLEPTLAAQGRTGVVMMFNLFWTILTIATVWIASPFGLETLAWSQTAVAACTLISVILVLHYVARIEVRGAIVAILSAGVLVLGYAALLNFTWGILHKNVDLSVEITLLIGLIWAVILGLLTLLLSWRLRILDLGIFSG